MQEKASCVTLRIVPLEEFRRQAIDISQHALGLANYRIVSLPHIGMQREELCIAAQALDVVF
jgi:hypothetical protein